ncbi:MAG: PadR family transcriptional regulator [Acidobacteria bacterium]|nr:PadR family transcriptional regulator [Acidobacteriota bacterium]
MSASRSPDRALPSPVLYILLSLADEERHGYAIMQEVRARTAGRVVLGPGALYTSLQRALQAGYIVETPAPRGQEPDARGRRSYRLTPAGRRAARRELARLQAVMQMARRARLTPLPEVER